MNILIFSVNEVFKNDLAAQLERFANGKSDANKTPDVIIVDEDQQLYAEKRKLYPAVPIILLTSEAVQTEDNLNLAVRKPFKLAEFLDTVLAVNNRLDNSSDGYLSFNGWELRPSKKEISDLKSGKTVKLTEKEVAVIKYLYKKHGKTVSKTELQKNVWQYSETVTTHTVETHIYRLRRKTEKTGRRLIITDNGKYGLCSEDAETD